MLEARLTIHCERVQVETRYRTQSHGDRVVIIDLRRSCNSAFSGAIQWMAPAVTRYQIRLHA